MLKKILQFFLYSLAKAALWRQRPKIVAITGNVGKTSTKDAIMTVLSSHFRVRGPAGNFNNEIGVPLTILNWPNYGRNLFGWLVQMLLFPFQLLLRDETEILVLEMGADRPGDIKKLVNLARPDIGVVTAIGEIPVHVEFFRSPDDLAEEKSELVHALPDNGIAVLNFDDPKVKGMAGRTRASVIGYGTGGEAEHRIQNIALYYDAAGIPEGIAFGIGRDDAVTTIKLPGSLNRAQVLAAGAAYAVGTALGMNPAEIKQALLSYAPPPGRMRLIKGNKGSLILDDTYNASPAATEAALRALLEIKGTRKIAVLGDMLELGAYTEEAHRKIGKLAAQTVSLLFTIGTRAEFMRDEALRNGLPENQTFHFLTSTEAEAVLEPLLRPGDIVLVKGSQGMRLERVVREIMQEPLRAGELLCRQTSEWLKKN